MYRYVYVLHLYVHVHLVQDAYSFFYNFEIITQYTNHKHRKHLKTQNKEFKNVSLFLGVSILHSGLGVKSNICLDLKLWFKPFLFFLFRSYGYKFATKLQICPKADEEWVSTIIDTKSNLD